MRRFGSKQQSSRNSTYEDMRRAFDAIKTRLANASSSMISVDPSTAVQGDGPCAGERSACDFTSISSDEDSCSNTLVSIGPEYRGAVDDAGTVCSETSTNKAGHCTEHIESNKRPNTSLSAKYTSAELNDNQEISKSQGCEEKADDQMITRELIHEESLSDEMDYKELGFVSFLGIFDGEAQQVDNITFRRMRGEADGISHSDMCTEGMRTDMQHLKKIRFDQMPKDVRKIGEATFSEVFAHGTLVYKIIPLGKSSNETCMQSFLKESSIFQTICNEEGVCRLVDVFLLKGRYSEEYLRAWDEYGEEENERPCKYNEEQEYGVLAMEDGGMSLEDVKFTDCSEVNRFLKSVARALANLEEKYEFEHRDLHWGNILISGGKVNLIDFSLSRIRSSGRVIYEDLNAKEWLFEGDESIDIQFGVYKQMRVLSCSDWQAFVPRSNVLWMKYLVQKAFSKVRFRGRSSVISQYIRIMDSSSSMIEAEQMLNKCTKIQ
jgi:serine/threonine-protein kinase haspin